jgi:CRISPR system Cascade subunit CasD
VDDPVRELMERVPLSLPKASQYTPPPKAADIEVDFLWEHYPHRQLPDDAVTLTANDIPISFAPHHRSHSKRSIHRTTELLPAALHGEHATLHQRLIDYAKKDA